MSDKKKRILGLDIGSVSLAAVTVDASGTTHGRLYFAHGGNIASALERVDAELDLAGVEAVALTGRPLAEIEADARYESQVAALESVKARYPDAGAILTVGGENYSLARFNERGEYEGTRSNSGCAAGTGSFLDQQAGRLQLADSAELARIAGENYDVGIPRDVATRRDAATRRDEPPKVATRCAVFAKTDLIHAQQEGYPLAAIADGLCQGLARNLVDALWSGVAVREPVVFTGGVAMNDAVLGQLRSLTGVELVRDAEAPWHGAIGAALLYLKETREKVAEAAPFASAAALRKESPPDRTLFHQPLALRLSTYPDFTAHERYLEQTAGRGRRPGLDVEVDVYETIPATLQAWLGVDIGSTSTKAVLVDGTGRVAAGLYTRTSGRPVEAFQALLEALAKLGVRKGSSIAVLGCATTGSGRKFIGGIAGADLVLDEISAHARAAVELDPDVDTIIEIGGQDSKFTTLRDGRVTSSIMNNVCAAGTGSFIEEQARKLGVDLADYARLTDGVRAPRVSDRCTVFMERDMNHLLSAGCTVPEVLAAALHAVRENYLRKVASEKSIGKVVFFQGATARNRSLVAAFEQKLGRPILVSPFCHLTGAYGAALALRDERTPALRDERIPVAGISAFRGLDLYRRDLPVRAEVCGLCGNHCKLSVASVNGEELAFGFLCGRDYGTKSFVARKAGVARLAVLRAAADREASESLRQEAPPAAIAMADPRHRAVIGLPAALSLVEDLGFWKVFFRSLGLSVRVSDDRSDMVAKGKQRMGAEFCAPMAAFFGHALALLDEADFVFIPLHLEKKGDKGEGMRQYCYSTQFASPLVSQLDESGRFLAPIVEASYTSFRVKEELRRCLADRARLSVTFKSVSAAWDRAEHYREARAAALRSAFAARGRSGDIEIVVLGRPYSVLPAGMNKGIPDMIADHGVPAWYQDMLEPVAPADSRIQALLHEIPWEYGKTVLRAAETVARIPGAYPTLVTSFKCGPDSFVVDAFKALMDAYGKPYLVLELDEHDSAVGYETRVEAAIRAFRNHRERNLAREKAPAGERDFLRVNPSYATALKGKTLLLPSWDELAAPLLAASLRAAGVDAVVMEESDETIRASLSTNNGQCLPLNAIAESFAHTVRSHGLDPANCAVWMARAKMACDIQLYPHQIKNILDGKAEGFEKAGVYVGELSFLEISPLAAVDAYQSYLFAGLIRRLSCRIRPYETIKGMTDAMTARAMEILVATFEDRRRNKVKAAEEIVSLFEAIPYDRSRRNPLVALFGDLYVRDNSVMNQDVIRYIEDNGGEVISMPYNQYAKMISDTYFSRWAKEGRYADLLRFNALLAASKVLEKAYYRVFDRMLEETDPEFDDSSADILARYGVLVENSGESAENLLKTWYIKKHFPEVSLFVQLSPIFCCAALVTEAMNRKIEEVTGVPVLSLTYDGTGGGKNEALAPYLKYPRKAEPRSRRFEQGDQERIG